MRPLNGVMAGKRGCVPGTGPLRLAIPSGSDVPRMGCDKISKVMFRGSNSCTAALAGEPVRNHPSSGAFHLCQSYHHDGDKPYRTILFMKHYINLNISFNCQIGEYGDLL